MRKFLISLASLSFFAGCTAIDTNAPHNEFAHEISPPQPWPHENFDASDEKFSFAIISDLNGGEREGVFEVAVAQLNLLRPEFIISVGDLIDGGTEDVSQLEEEWDWFDERAAKAQAPLFYVGGNHDLTNQTMRDVWQSRYGPRYYHFVYGDILFLMMDTEDYSDARMQEIYLARAAAIEVLDGDKPEKAREMEYFKMPERVTGEVGDEQAAYIEKAIAENPDVRWTFVFMHKPVWMREDENAFARVETALGDRPYTLFNGHFHAYAHHLRNDRDHIILGTTGGGQDAKNDASFDHVTLVTMDQDGPSIATLRMDGILDKSGEIPAGGNEMCLQASRCEN